MSDQEKIKEANEQIANILKEIQAKFTEAAKIADDAGVDFRFEGPIYGTGGHYNPQECESSDEYTSEDVGWQASSQSCW